MSHRHRCSRCGRRFWLFGSFMRHIIRTHPSEIPRPRTLK
jgi:hypothetical protein